MKVIEYKILNNIIHEAKFAMEFSTSSIMLVLKSLEHFRFWIFKLGTLNCKSSNSWEVAVSSSSINAWCSLIYLFVSSFMF
jgi:hypothetical protein